MKDKIIVIAGPTASGKTSLSIELAKNIDGEIISADSMQIYKDMNIGTAKVTVEEMENIKHYMIDIVSPEQRYSVSDFNKESLIIIKDIIERNKVPIVVGGTGLYIDSLVDGIQYQDINFDENYRLELTNLAETEQGLKKLYEKANEIDPEATSKISSNDKKRIIRILEIYKATGKNKTEQERLSRLNGVKYDYKVFALNMERDKLYERINLRVDKMIEAGLIEEVKALKDKYKKFPTAMQGLGYKEVVCYLEGQCSRNEMIEKIKQESRRYAKRQLTWFRKNKNIVWLDAENKLQNNIDIILEVYNK